MRVLVTGAGGYLGSVLVPALLAAGHHVVALDTFRHGPTLAACAAEPTLDIVVDDARGNYLLHSILPKVDAIIPLAAVVGEPACDRDSDGAITTNDTAISNLCSFVSKDQIIIYPNTNSGYGSTLGVSTEMTPLNPLSHYARTKANGEKYVLRVGGISLRLGTVYGASPRLRTDLLVNNFVLRALRDRALVLFEPQARRDYVHVRDVSGVFLHALGGHLSGSEVYNVASENFSKEALCSRIAEISPYPFSWVVGPGADPDRRDYLVSTEKLRGTGWIPHYTVDDGIREMLKLLPTLQPIYGNV